MFKKILVPLDGSKLAECSLTYAEELAINCSATELVLVSVTERIVAKTQAPEINEMYVASGEDGIFGGSKGSTLILGKLEKQAYNYLNKIAKKIKTKGITVRVDVLIGNPAEQITKYAEEGNFEIIVMASHGRSGPSRWALGSVTDKIFRGSCIPVLLIRAPGCYPGI